MARRITLPSADDLFGSESDQVAPRPAPNGTAGAGRHGGAATRQRGGRARRSPAARRAQPATASAPADAPAVAPTGRKATTARPRRSGDARATPRSRTAPRAAQARTAIDRMRTVESRLDRLPVDVLIDLRDGLEDLLSTADVDVDALETLLDTVGA